VQKKHNIAKLRHRYVNQAYALLSPSGGSRSTEGVNPGENHSPSQVA